MQKVLTAPPAAQRSLRSGLAALLLCGMTAGAGAIAQAQVVAPPTGTVWDCVLSGSGQKGIAFITFTDDGTFSGYQILAPSVNGDKSLEGRNIGGGIGRSIETDGTTSPTNLFGFDQFEGPWAYDANGKVIGNFAQVVGGEGDSPDSITNSVSFVAKVVVGKRLTLVASTSHGKLTYKGVPYTGTAPSFDGAWYRTEKIQQQWFTEFYTFTSVAESNPFPDLLPDLSEYPGIYFTQNGQGPTYELAGFAMLSSQKKIAFAFESFAFGGTNGVLNATFGSLSSSKGAVKATTAGIESPNTTIRYTFQRPTSP